MCKRILIYGVTGCGKSTLAKTLAERLSLPVYHVDDICHEDGQAWKLRKAEDSIELISEIVARDEWILDGGYATWLGVALARVELVVALDYARATSFARLLRRTVRLCRTGEKVCNGNVQTWRNTLTHNSILVWHFQSFARKRNRMRGWAASPQSFHVVLLNTPDETVRWVESLPESLPTG